MKNRGNQIKIFGFFYGFLTILFQTVLFREFLIAFNGNEIGISAFFSSWLFWIFVGAFIGSYLKLRVKTKNPVFFLFFYLPLIIFQYVLILNLRKISGILSYELFPVGKLVLITFLINSPISLFTGFLFPAASNHFKETLKGKTVASLYAWEAFGGFFGGIFCTVLFYLAQSSFSVLYYGTVLFLLFFLIAMFFGVQKKAARAGVLVAFVLVLCSIFWVNTDFVYQLKKDRILKDSKLLGAWSSETGEILYLKRNNQKIVVYNGNIGEVFPNEEKNGVLEGLLLASNPDTKNILIIGEGASLAMKLQRVTVIKNIYLYFPDKDYYEIVFKKILNKHPAKVRVIKDSPISFLKKNGVKVDAILILVGDPITTAQNRFYTKEFFKSSLSVLNEYGIILAEITGIENFAGSEASNLGISVYKTLKKVFKKVVIKPGSSTVFIASNSLKITDKPFILQKRYEKFLALGADFPKTAFFTLFNRDRIKFVKKIYEKNGNLPEKYYINSSLKPVSYLFSILLLGKYTKSQITKVLKKFIYIDLKFIITILLISLLLFYLYNRRTFGKHSVNTSFETVLVFFSGFCGMILNITLIYTFQERFGSIFLYIGLVSSLFMLGIFIGSEAVNKFSELFENPLRSSVFVVLSLLVSSLFSAVVPLLSGGSSLLFFVFLFFVAGVITGLLFAISSILLFSKEVDAHKIGAILESYDHLGASFGALITGIIFIPVLGIFKTFLVVGISYGFVIAFYLIVKVLVKTSRTPQPYFRYGLIAFLVMSFFLLLNGYAKFKVKVHKQIKISKYVAASDVKKLLKEGETFSAENQYFVIKKGDKTVSYVFSSYDFSPDVSGYGGKLNVVIRVSEDGVLEDFFIKESNETPFYLNRVLDHKQKFTGKNIFGELGRVDTVSGATVTSSALLKIFEKSGKSFFKKVLHKEISFKQRKKSVDLKFVYLLGAIVAGILLLFLKNMKVRYAVLLINTIIGGFVFNIQLSMDQVGSILFFNIPFDFTGFIFLLVVVVPVLVAVFGNFYCGSVCPFGAMQELIFDVSPFKVKEKLMFEDKGQNFKYALFFFITILFLISGNRDILDVDPLVSFFDFHLATVIWGVVVLSLVLSAFYPRFWCRNLCPVGAFLSIISFFKPANAIFPKKIYRNCEFGVKTPYQLDCIQCNRCLRNTKK